jgi:microcystin-dependent protein
MADRRISQLAAADTLVENDLLPFVDISDTETKRITAENLGAAMVQFGTTRGSDVPTSPANGQLWVDTSNNPPELKIYNGASFSLVSFLPSSAVITNPSGTAPSSPTLGQLWLDTSTTPDELKVYDGSQFVRVDPLGITQTAGDARYLQITTASTTYLPLAGGTLTGTLTLDAAPTADLQAATKKYVDDEIAGIDVSDPTPSGTIIYTARTTAPTGYLKANGAAVSRTTYADLFTAIGTIYGSGDGSTTFNVPDLRGEFVRGFDDSRGVDSGRTLGSAQAEMIGQHNHTVNDPGHSHSLNYTPIKDGGGILAGRDGPAHNMSTGGGVNGNTTGISINNNSGTENRPRNVALLACIKT